jgi:enoyl-CoA hydratase/carnithine racemase
MNANATVQIKKDNGIVIATLNRPDKMNALNKDVFDELTRLLDVLETDKTTRALIITGHGDKAFCVGADLKERQGMNEKDVLVRLEFVKNLFLRIEKLSVPVIAAVNGMALGGGTELALLADFRVAADNAVFSLPETDLGIIPGCGGTQRLPRLVGVGKAMEMIMLGKRMNAQEALHIGLIHSVAPAGGALAQSLTLGAKILEAGPIAIKQAKYAVRFGLDLSLADGLKLELEAYKVCLYSKDRLEGLKAFNEKRRPIYRGE